jgi:hypothetical protein
MRKGVPDGIADYSGLIGAFYGSPLISRYFPVFPGISRHIVTGIITTV